MEHPLIFDGDLSDGALARFLKAAEKAHLYGTVEVTGETAGTLTAVSGQLALPVQHHSAEEARAALVDLLFRLLENRTGSYRVVPLTEVPGADRSATVATSKVLMEAMIRRVSGGSRPLPEAQEPAVEVTTAPTPRPAVVRPPVQAPVPGQAMLDAAARLFDAADAAAATPPGPTTPPGHAPAATSSPMVPAAQPPGRPATTPVPQPPAERPIVGQTPTVPDPTTTPASPAGRVAAEHPPTGTAPTTPVPGPAPIPGADDPAVRTAPAEPAARRSLAARLRERDPAHPPHEAPHGDPGSPPADPVSPDGVPAVPVDAGRLPPAPGVGSSRADVDPSYRGIAGQPLSHQDRPAATTGPVAAPTPVGDATPLRRSDDPRPGDRPAVGRQRRAADLRRSLGSGPSSPPEGPAPDRANDQAATTADAPPPAGDGHRQPNRRSALRNLIRTLTS